MSEYLRQNNGTVILKSSAFIIALEISRQYFINLEQTSEKKSLDAPKEFCVVKYFNSFI